MQTSVIGFPRIGALRELKFASEKYFKKEQTEDELLETAAALRKKHWQTQAEAGIDHIPCNDFSFYDTVLDTAVMLNLIPKRYAALRLSDTDTYFAMARGYQGAAGDVRALAMKKWFHTNYHYIVPELEDDTQVSLSAGKLFGEYAEAAAIGIETKPVVIGPYTMLKLCRYTGVKTADDHKAAFIAAYQELLAGAAERHVTWLQMDEPALVQDMSTSDIRLFVQLYEQILSKKGNVKVLLQTYFGDVRDSYTELIRLPFDGLGLDLIEGTKNQELIRTYGFPADKVLFAGLVNGRNIWKNRYDRTLQILHQLRADGIQTVLSTSCSLLHVPYTTKQETRLEEKYLRHFSFAEEKLIELQELGRLAECADAQTDPAYVRNRELFAAPRDCHDAKVTERLSHITDSDHIRLPKRSERQRLQKQAFHLPVAPTTTIGSFPQTADVKAARAAYRKHTCTEQEYRDFIRKKIAECIAWQERLGLDVLVHGEYERNDMVEYFGEALDGFLFTEKAWVQSYGTRCVKPPVIWGDVSRKAPMTVEWSVYAQSLTKKPVKGMLTGPVTIWNWSFPREDISAKESMSQIALAIRDEVLDLEKNGIRIIQIDEAALREKLPLRKTDWYSGYLDFVIPIFRLTHSGVKPETQIHTHMCYSEFTDIIPAIDDMDADVITFEASRSDLEILDALKENHFETEVGAGVYDIHSPRVPSVEEIVQSLKLMLTKIDAQKLWVNPDCGLKTRGVTETEASLAHMVEAAEELRTMIG